MLRVNKCRNGARIALKQQDKMKGGVTDSWFGETGMTGASSVAEVTKGPIL